MDQQVLKRPGFDDLQSRSDKAIEIDGLIGPRGGRLRHGRAVCLFVLVVGCGCGQKSMIYSRLMHVIADDYSFILYQNVHKATLSRVYYYQMESMNS